ncbi:MAG: hypothetical protein MJ177_02530 [Clostridia bacterium]|nr:hypothetical protein [Clostridia bacterium]
MDDLRCKLLECKECEGVWGTFVGGWFHGFYRMTRFGLGRFQFEYSTVDDDYTLADGTVIPAGTKCVGMHIPSSGISLTDDVRYDSYKRAFDFFESEKYGDKLIIKCGSWLLYPKHREFLPPHLNILKFMNDFDIIAEGEKEGFSNDWRVFGRYSDLPYAELPEDTALRRAYKKHLLETGKAGDGFGYILFDGEKIINKR